jgi:hypothetical protein
VIAAEVEQEVVARIQTELGQARHVTEPEVDRGLRRGGALVCLSDRARDVVDRRHLPPMGRHVDRFAAFSRTNVEGAAWRQRRGAFDDLVELVRMDSVPGREAHQVHQPVNGA